MITINSIPNSQKSSEVDTLEFKVESNEILARLCGPLESNIAHLEIAFDAQLSRKGNTIFIQCGKSDGTKICKALEFLCNKVKSGNTIQPSDIDSAIKRISYSDELSESKKLYKEKLGGKNQDFKAFERLEFLSKKELVIPKTDRQRFYLKLLHQKEIVFGVGPAGTGKTYLAIAAAVSQFLKGKVDKIILTRPAVEAGEQLGFLPGDIKDKVDPYMQPLYDSLYKFLPSGQVSRMVESGKIQVVPLAFMRGRTLSNSFIILDEAQNTTKVQMKMFLTRLGENSQMVITGDLTQIDLAKPQDSGLLHASKILKNLSGIGFSYFDSSDIVRHALVEKIILAYNDHK